MSAPPVTDDTSPESAESAAETPKKSRLPSLYVQVLIAIALGVVVGRFFPHAGVMLKPLGDAFVKLIKMLIGPIVFTTVAVGIAGMGDLKKTGRVGGKAVLWFEMMSTVALILGMTMVHLVGPGRGLHIDVHSIDTTELDAQLAPKGGVTPPHGVVGHLMALIPETFAGAFTGGDILQVLFLAVLTGSAIGAIGPRGKPLVTLLEQTSSVFFAIVGMIMRVAPIGAFGAMAFTIGKFGLGTLGNLAKLMGTFYGTALLFVLVVLGIVLRVLGLSIFKLLRYLREELVLVLGTSSSETALPKLMAKLEKLGCKPEIVRLVVPTGYSFNLDGTCIYLTMAALFVAQALDVKLTLVDELTLFAILLLTSKGAAGVTGSGFITLAATLSATHVIPVEGLALLVGIDRFMSEARALTNMVGNAVATLVVSKWEGELDLATARSVLDGVGTKKPAS
ncbi:dicarboxylate/amino acid:cation symporter [soil metagenome]